MEQEEENITESTTQTNAAGSVGATKKSERPEPPGCLMRFFIAIVTIIVVELVLIVVYSLIFPPDMELSDGMINFLRGLELFILFCIGHYLRKKYYPEEEAGDYEGDELSQSKKQEISAVQPKDALVKSVSEDTPDIEIPTDAEEQYALALSYDDGEDDSHARTARMLYKLASDQGNVKAMYKLGAIYERGRGVKKNVNYARMMYSRAAELGMPAAQYRFACMLHRGLGGCRIPSEALYWLRKSARQGYRPARLVLKIAGKRM